MPNFCTDCKHSVKVHEYECRHPANFSEYAVDLVTGAPKSVLIGAEFCSTHRGFMLDHLCGVDGRWFDKK